MQYILYPRVMKSLKDGAVLDLGFGAGSFLRFLKSKKLQSFGIDSNKDFVEGASREGFDVAVDDLTKLETVRAPISNAVCDNVLEHLARPQIDAFFTALKSKMKVGARLVLIVPDKQGYKKDPTHCTFVDKAMINEFCTVHNLNLIDFSRFPFNSKFVGNILYLNMQIFVIEFP